MCTRRARQKKCFDAFCPPLQPPVYGRKKAGRMHDAESRVLVSISEVNYISSPCGRLCQNWARKSFFPSCSSTQSNCGEHFFFPLVFVPPPLSEGEAKKRGQIKGCPTPHAWEMSLAFKMLQVWQMLTATKWLITGTEKKSRGEAITSALA